MKKMLLTASSLLMALALATSCSQEDSVLEQLEKTAVSAEVQEPVIFKAAFEKSDDATTRTVLQSDNSVFWAQNDDVKIFAGSNSYKYLAETAGEFTLLKPNSTSAGSASTYYALYPYQEGATLSGTNITSVSIPTEQTAVAGTFDPAANITVASTTDSNLFFEFKNSLALLKFTLGGNASQVTSIKLQAVANDAALTGTASVAVSAEPSLTFSASENYAVLNAPADGFKSGQTYYIAVAPSTLTDGFGLIFKNASGQVYIQSFTSKAATFTRSHILNVGSINVGTFSNALTSSLLMSAAEHRTGKTFTKQFGIALLSNTNNQNIINATKVLGLGGYSGMAVSSSYNDIGNNEVDGDTSVYEELGYFTKLETLVIVDHEIKSIDLSANPGLKELYIHSYPLTSLNISANTALTKLGLNCSNLTSLDITKQTELTSLFFDTTGLISSLDLSKNTKLTTFQTNNSNVTIKSLDFTKCSELTKVIFMNGTDQLESIDVSGLKKLSLLYNQSGPSTNSKLSTLNISNATISEINFTGHKKLTSLDLSTVSGLTKLYCYGCGLSSLDVHELSTLNLSNLTCGAQVDASGRDQIMTLTVSAAQYSAYPYPNMETSSYSNDRNVKVVVYGNINEGFTEDTY